MRPDRVAGPARFIDPRAARAVCTALLVLAAAYAVYAVRVTLLVLVIAGFFSYLVLPLVRAGERVSARVPRPVLVAVAYVIVLGLLGGGATLFGAAIEEQARGLVRELPQLLDANTLARRLPLPTFLEPFRDRLVALLRGVLATTQPQQALPAAQRFGAHVLSAAGYLIYVVVVPILSFLMVRAGPNLQRWLDRLATRPGGSFWATLAQDLNRLLAHYVRALALLSMAALLIYGTVLSALGVPFALLLTGFAAALEVIPVFGPLVGATAIVLVALFSGYPHVWWLVAFLMAYRIFQDYVLNPWLMSEGVDVPAFLVIVGLLAGDELAGVAGIFLSVPVIAAVRIFVARLALREGGMSRETAA